MKDCFVENWQFSLEMDSFSAQVVFVSDLLGTVLNQTDKITPV